MQPTVRTDIAVCPNRNCVLYVDPQSRASRRDTGRDNDSSEATGPAFAACLAGPDRVREPRGRLTASGRTTHRIRDVLSFLRSSEEGV